MNKLISLFIALFVGALVFIVITRLWFEYVPLTWIYTFKGLIDIYGDESTLSVLGFSSLIAGFIPAAIIAVVIYRKV